MNYNSYQIILLLGKENAKKNVFLKQRFKVYNIFRFYCIKTNNFLTKK